MATSDFTYRLTEFMESNKQRLFRYAFYRTGNTADAEDMLQNTYLSLLEGKNRNVADLQAYVFRTLSNECSRSQKLHKPSSAEIPDIADSYDGRSLFEDEYDRITALLDLLPEMQREVIRLKIFAGMTFDEAGGVLQMPVSTVKERYYTALENIRKRINR